MSNNIKFAKTTRPQVDNKAFPIVTVTYLERIADVATAENYGIHGSPPIGTAALMFTINNDEANRIIIPLSAETRTKDLEEGEFECGNFKVGSTIKFDKDGNITIIAAGGNINVTGDIHVTGAIDATGDIVAGTVSLKTHIHSGVQSGGSTSGPPVP